MRLDVYFAPGEVGPGDLTGRTVVVLDVLRATSVIVAALAAGARAIYPVGSVEEALRLANTLGRGDVVLCGERRCLPIEGFDLGNSPVEFTPERVAGKTLVMSTTNGTLAILASQGAARVLVGSLLNLSAVAEELARSAAEPVFICAGRERHFALDDAVAVGAVAQRLLELRPGEWRLNDGAQAALALAERFGCDAALFARTASGQAIAAAGLEADLDDCARLDEHAVLPTLHDRSIVLSGVGAAR